MLRKLCYHDFIVKFPTFINLKNIYLIPATYDLFYFTDSNLLSLDNSKTIAELKAKIRQYSFMLNTILNNSELDFDLILMDTNPYISLTSSNALIAADSIIGVLDASTDSIDGLKYLESVVSEIQQYVNPSLTLEGIVLNNNDKRTNFSEVMLKTTKKIYGDKLFKTVINPSIVNKESRAARMPLIEYDIKHLSAIQFADLASEFIKRVLL